MYDVNRTIDLKIRQTGWIKHIKHLKAIKGNELANRKLRVARISRVNGRPKNFNLSTIKIMCETGCYANHWLEAWVAVLLESLLAMCSMSNGCSCKHELVAGRKKTRVEQSQKCNLYFNHKKLCLRMKAKQLQQLPTRPDNECSWTEALSRKQKTWLRTVAFHRRLVASIIPWGFSRNGKICKTANDTPFIDWPDSQIIIACFVAAASTSSGRHISWPLDPVMPSSSFLFCSCNHADSR